MIITRTPFRISFFGGGSDLPSYYEPNQKGAVLSTTFNQYMYIVSHPYFHKDEYLLKYSKTENEKDINKIDHQILKATFKHLNIDPGIEITSIADIPAGSGLGSSSTFTVGLLHNLYVYKKYLDYNNHYLDRKKLVIKHELAELACKIEIELMKKPIGKQDQYAASFGGFQIYEFYKEGHVETCPFPIRYKTLKELENNLFLFFVGNDNRDADKILAKQSKQVGMSAKKTETLHKMVDMVYEAKDALLANHPDHMGTLLNRAWEYKRSLCSNISNKTIDDTYEKALKAGALGGKLLGAGGGGFLLLYIPKNKQETVIKKLGLQYIDLAFENMGTTATTY